MAGNFLTPGEVDIIETAKAKKELIKERKDLAKAKKELRGKTIGGGIKKVLFAKDKPAGRNPFGKKPVQEDFTREQHILRGMFGHGDRVLTNFDGRSLPKLHNTLNSGGGLIKSGDQGETGNLFYGGKALPFFGGARR